MNDGKTTLLLQVTLRHGMTGLSNSYEVPFDKGSIKLGSFVSGNGFAIH